MIETVSTDKALSETVSLLTYMAQDQACEQLDVLARTDCKQFRHICEQMIKCLSQQLHAGDEAVESTLFCVYKRLADHFLADTHTAFTQLVELAQDWPLQDSINQQWRTYFSGVAVFQAECYDDAIAIFDRLLAAPDLDLAVRARTLNSRAIGLRISGQLEEALLGYQESLKIWQQLGDEVSAGKALLNMGTSAYYLRNYRAAECWLHKAVTSFEQHGLLILLGAAQNGLGLVYRDQGRWAEALTCFQAYIAYGQAENASNVVGIGLLNVGEVLLFQGRIAEAIATLHTTLDKMTRHLYRVDVYLYLGLAYQARNQPPQAKAAFVQALELAHDIGRREIVPAIHYWLGIVAQALGQSDGAVAHFDIAVQVIDATRAPMHDEEVKISLLGLWQQVYEALVLTYFDDYARDRAFMWAERARARAFAEAVGQSREGEDSKASEDGKESKAIATVADIQAVLPRDGGRTLLFYDRGAG